jgi:hypothetical protein
LVSDYRTGFPDTKYIGGQFRDQGADAIYLCVISSIPESVKLARLIADSGGYYYFPLKAHPTARYFDFDSEAKQCLVDSIPGGGRSHFDSMDYENIIQALKNALRLDGVFVEIGTFEGRSSQIMLDYMRRIGASRPLYCLDTFEGMEFESAATTSDAAWFGTHTDTTKNSFSAVKDFLSVYGKPNLVKMDITEAELPEEIDKISFCNLDVDMHEAYLAALTKVHSRMVIGGIILMEDYGHSPYIIGAQLALEDFFELGFRKNYMDFYLSSGQIMLVKLSD